MVAFEEVEAADKDQIQLLVGFDEDHRFVTYSPQDFAVISGLTYYVDAVNGNDSNDGLTEENAWKSLDQVNSTTFLPGRFYSVKGRLYLERISVSEGRGKRERPCHTRKVWRRRISDY